MREKVHRCSDSDYSKQAHIQQKKGETNFCKGNEARALALAMCQIEIQEMASRKKKSNKNIIFAQAYGIKAGLNKSGKKGKKGVHNEVKELNDTKIYKV